MQYIYAGRGSLKLDLFMMCTIWAQVVGSVSYFRVDSSRDQEWDIILRQFLQAVAAYSSHWTGGSNQNVDHNRQSRSLPYFWGRVVLCASWIISVLYSESVVNYYREDIEVM
jgi:hypothetical protein